MTIECVGIDICSSWVYDIIWNDIRWYVVNNLQAANNKKAVPISSYVCIYETCLIQLKDAFVVWIHSQKFYSKRPTTLEKYLLRIIYVAPDDTQFK